MRVPFTIYDLATGKIKRSGACAERDLLKQKFDPATEGLMRAKSDPLADEVKGGLVQNIPRSEDDLKNERLQEVRMKRNRLLQATDWTQVEDAPLETSEKRAWARYRRELRQLPEELEKNEDFPWPKPPGENTQGKKPKRT